MNPWGFNGFLFLAQHIQILGHFKPASQESHTEETFFFADKSLAVPL